MLRPQLEHARLSVGPTMHQPDREIEFSYFLNAGLISLIVDTESGKTVEVGISGYEGMTGVALLAGLKRTTYRAVIEVAGDGFRIKANALREVLGELQNFMRLPTDLQPCNHCKLRKQQPAIDYPDNPENGAMAADDRRSGTG